jgi:hypothetical protein
MGIKRTGHEADGSLPSRAEVKSSGAVRHFVATTSFDPHVEEHQAVFSDTSVPLASAVGKELP